MANFQKKHHSYRGCHLCKPQKDMGNSIQAIKAKYQIIKKTRIIYDTDQAD